MSIDLSTKQIEKLERALKLEQGGLGAFLETIDELEDKMDEIKEILAGKSLIKGEKGERGEAGRDGLNGKNGLDGKNGKDGRDGRDGLDGRDGKDGENGKDGADGKNGKNGDEIEGKEIVKKINDLDLKPDLMIDAKHIKNLPITMTAGGGSSGGGRIVKTYDISDQLNGVLKTFSLPAFWRIIDVQIGTIPPLRPTVDYTCNASAMTITFTDEIDASVYLQSGLSAIVIYSE